MKSGFPTQVFSIASPSVISVLHLGQFMCHLFLFCFLLEDQRGFKVLVPVQDAWFVSSALLEPPFPLTVDSFMHLLVCFFCLFLLSFGSHVISGGGGLGGGRLTLASSQKTTVMRGLSEESAFGFLRREPG
jgi:hypothetical protein